MNLSVIVSILAVAGLVAFMLVGSRVGDLGRALRATRERIEHLAEHTPRDLDVAGAIAHGYGSLARRLDGVNERIDALHRDFPGLASTVPRSRVAEARVAPFINPFPPLFTQAPPSAFIRPGDADRNDADTEPYFWHADAIAAEARPGAAFDPDPDPGPSLALVGPVS